MKKGINNKYTTIENYANKHNYQLSEYGVEIVGEHFIKLSHNEDDLTISFVLVGMNTEYIYECIYSDL